MIWEKGENIFFQKLQKPISLNIAVPSRMQQSYATLSQAEQQLLILYSTRNRYNLQARVHLLGVDPDQPTLEELDELVREHRQ